MTDTQAAILTVTLNPALDISVDAPNVAPGGKIRVGQPVAEPGGGGINVSRAIRLLGGQSQALAALGGLTGAKLKRLLRAEGVALLVHRIEGESRQNLTVTDTGDGAQYRFTMPGPEWRGDQGDAMQQAIAAQLASRGLAVLSGSQPPGVPAAFAADLARRAADAGTRLIVDTSGPALAQLLDTPGAKPPFMLRLDEAEARAVQDAPLAPPAAAALAADLVARGVAAVVIVACGADGSVLVGQGARLHCAPPRVEVLSKVGAGDSFTAGFTLALARGQSLSEALQLGTAAAAAAVMTGSTELCRPQDVQALLPDCRVSAL